MRLLALSILLSLPALAAPPAVTARRAPDGGIQPRIALDSAGAVHLIYFKGDPKAGDVFYARSPDGGTSFSPPVRVNSQPGSAIAIGTVRGPQLAAGRNGRAYVIWMGSDSALPRGPSLNNRTTPLLYARLDDAGEAFEPQRNLITSHPGLDGGLSVAADADGNVYAVWHAPERGTQGEDNRKVWVSRSADDGRSFSPETAANPHPTGACGCCGMRAFCDRDGNLFIAYRSAAEIVHRDMYLLTSRDHAATFTAAKLDPMNIAKCVMSTTTLAPAAGGGLLAAWETDDRIFFSPVDPASPLRRIAAPVQSRPAKHPVIAANAAGQILLAWTEGTGWQKGGTLAWQIFDAQARPIANASGRAADLPAWSLPAAFAKPDGSFEILY